MNRNFDEWINNFKTSIANYGYYVDFNKIYNNLEQYKIRLNILNSLIGSSNIENEFRDILVQYPEVLECIPLLLAVRAKEIFIKEGINEYIFDFNRVVSVDEYVKFMDKSGLFELMKNHIINNLCDYALGVEVGLDSNGRKNRGGHLMEKLVESFIVQAGYIKDESYFKEMYIRDIEERWNLNLASISGDNVSTKRFDFVIKSENQVYVIETNFYAQGGSKLNETSRSYKMLAQETSEVDGVTFIWITDGTGWISARRNLNETFNEMNTLYNINDLEHGVLNHLN